MVHRFTSRIELSDGGGFYPSRHRVEYVSNNGESKYRKHQKDRLKAGKIHEYREKSSKHDVSVNKLMLFLFKEFNLFINRNNELEMETNEECVLFQHFDTIMKRLSDLDAIEKVFTNYEIVSDENQEGICIETSKQFVKIVLTSLFYTCLAPQKYTNSDIDIDHCKHLITVPEWYLLIANVLDGLIDPQTMTKINQIID
jgi:hypothetical protein